MQLSTFENDISTVVETVIDGYESHLLPYFTVLFEQHLSELDSEEHQHDVVGGTKEIAYIERETKTMVE